MASSFAQRDAAAIEHSTGCTARPKCLLHAGPLHRPYSPPPPTPHQLINHMLGTNIFRNGALTAFLSLTVFLATFYGQEVAAGACCHRDNQW